MQFRIIIILAFLVSGCSGSQKTVAFLKQCNQQRTSSNNLCQATIAELKQNLKGGRPLYYLGSDDRFHYLSYYYDKSIKMSAHFKILKTEFKPKKEIVFEGRDNFGYPVYLSEL